MEVGLRQQPAGSLFLGSSSENAKWFVLKALQLRVSVQGLIGIRPNRADCPAPRWAEALAQGFANLVNEDWAFRLVIS